MPLKEGELSKEDKPGFRKKAIGEKAELEDQGQWKGSPFESN